MSNSADTLPALSIEQFLRAMPKVELHCHLFGTVRQATFRALAAKTGNVVTPEEIDAF